MLSTLLHLIGFPNIVTWKHSLFKRITLQLFTDYLSHHLLYIEESHGVVVINLRNGVVHIINGIAYPFYGFFKVFHVDSRISFLETVEKEGYHFGMLRQVLVKGRLYLYKSTSISNGESKSFSITCFVSFSERLACSVEIFQSIPRVSSRTLPFTQRTNLLCV